MDYKRKRKRKGKRRGIAIGIQRETRGYYEDKKAMRQEKRQNQTNKTVGHRAAYARKYSHLGRQIPSLVLYTRLILVFVVQPCGSDYLVSTSELGGFSHQPSMGRLDIASAIQAQ